ncbi:LysR substrate-binding domain-containing protein [Shinella yambaruensis]|uniref:Transcriptional regulator n=1 Tax=Shinella yambaruensis TaxID=415996 RepID=A0ABQ5ZW01_9HYPH|nr:LysR substrate-binding domain-containing protein [Shinella yambaruensis]MCJ8028824.1 LysR substrate-binding domain-containing protein [Shinella yambaruensis]MCU7981880.1 LysR substrate-binding domain-containing protein [Shinella yambaruensis]GLR54864.1 transcriptional regulator [Shinella yambaruensis]
MALTHFSLTALRSFEVASRHLSFTKAADELFLTRSAISQQISLLEGQIGVKLFHRLHSKLVLSREGELLASAIRKSLLNIESALDSIRSSEISGKLVVGSLPSFGAKWLAPRISRFAELHPNIEIKLLSYISLDDVISNGVDIAVSFAREKQPGIQQEILLQDEIWPICAPSILRAEQPVNSADDLGYYPILHTTLEGLDFGASWDNWFAELGLPPFPPHRAISFSRAYMMIEAASRGQGIGIAMRSLVEQDVNSGKLLRLFDFRVEASKLIALFYPEAAEHRPAVRAFSAWIHEQLLKDRSSLSLAEPSPVCLD